MGQIYKRMEDSLWEVGQMCKCSPFGEIYKSTEDSLWGVMGQIFKSAEHSLWGMGWIYYFWSEPDL